MILSYFYPSIYVTTLELDNNSIIFNTSERNNSITRFFKDGKELIDNLSRTLPIAEIHKEELSKLSILELEDFIINQYYDALSASDIRKLISASEKLIIEDTKEYLKSLIPLNDDRVYHTNMRFMRSNSQINNWEYVRLSLSNIIILILEGSDKAYLNLPVLTTYKHHAKANISETEEDYIIESRLKDIGDTYKITIKINKKENNL